MSYSGSIPAGEISSRVGRVHAAMTDKNMAGLLVTAAPNILYLCGYEPVSSADFACLVLPVHGEGVLVKPDSGDRLALEAADLRQLAFPDASPLDTVGTIRTAISKLGLAGERLGIETAREGLTPWMFNALRTALPSANWVDASDLVINARLIKSAWEIEQLRRAASITEAGMQAGLGAVAAGRRDNDVAAAAIEAMLLAGSEQFSIEPLVLAGHRSGLPHSMYKRYVIRAGDTVQLELAGVHRRYSAPLFGTAVVGPPSTDVRRLAALSRGCLETVMRAVGPGRPIAEVARMVREYLQPVQAELWPRRYFGYTVGLGLPPTWTEEAVLIVEETDHLFEPGMVFHSPQSIRLPGRLGVGFSSTWLVTESGIDVICGREPDLWVVDG